MPLALILPRGDNDTYYEYLWVCVSFFVFFNLHTTRGFRAINQSKLSVLGPPNREWSLFTITFDYCCSEIDYLLCPSATLRRLALHICEFMCVCVCVCVRVRACVYLLSCT